MIIGVLSLHCIRNVESKQRNVFCSKCSTYLTYLWFKQLLTSHDFKAWSSLTCFRTILISSAKAFIIKILVLT
jgi:hypothetical protein